MKEAQFYKKLSNNNVQCRLCHHFCAIKKNRTGICRARKNIDGKLFSLIYGYPIAQNIDPVEKKPLFHFIPGSHTFSIGTFGCNFRCANCQNWDISQAEDIENKIGRLDFISPEKIVEEAIGNECQSISYTYNEPTIFAEYALDIMRLGHEKGLKNIWVSNGYMSDESLKKIIPYLNAANIDIKSMDEDFYKSNCGARLEPVLSNLKKINNEQIHLEITTLLIPELSDNLDTLKNLANFIASEFDAETPWHISRFSPEISWKLKDKNTTKDEVVYEAYEIGKNAGLKYVYAGNMPGDEKENTYCPTCGELAVRRFGYDVERFDQNGLCANCEKSLNIIG